MRLLDMLVLPCGGRSWAYDAGFTCVRSMDVGFVASYAEHELGHELGLHHAAQLNDVRPSPMAPAGRREHAAGTDYDECVYQRSLGRVCL